MKAFDRTALTAELKRLTKPALVAYALSCCERLFPNYEVFSTTFRWGDPGVLRRALELAWSVLDGAMLSPQTFSEMQAQLQEAEPETEMFDSILASSALDAVSSIELLFEYLNGDNVEHVVDIASLCRDTVDMYVQELDGLEPSDPDLDQRIVSHDLMQEELRRQSEDVELLSRLCQRGEGFAHLRARWASPRQSNIRLPPM